MRAIAALVPLAALACKTAVRPTARAETPSSADAGATDTGPPPSEPAPPPPQPFAIIATISDLAVAKLEFALRALEGPFFDPRVDPQRPRSEPRSSEPLPEAAAPLELVPFSGRLFIGIADEERSHPLAALAQLSASQNRPVPAAEALQLTGGAGPLPAFGFALPGRVALFAAAADALDKVRTAGALSALADPALASDLLRCLPQHRLAQLALREVIGRQSEGLDATLDEARADLVPHVLAADPPPRELGLL